MAKVSINTVLLFLFFGITLSVIVLSCKKKTKENLEPYANVTLNVVSTSTNSTDSIGLEYFIFDNEQDFTNATSATAPSNYTLSGTVTGSTINIPQLPSGSDHYILVRYYDTKTFPGFSILYTNEESTFLIPSLQDQANMQGELQLKPQEGLFTFVAKSGDSGLFPTSLTIDNVTSVAPVFPGTIKLRKGQYSIKGKNTLTDNCIWMRTASILPGQNTVLEYESCDYGQVAFYSLVGSTTGIQISIGANKDNIIGTLITPSSQIPSTCDDPSIVHTILSPGKYSYYAFDPVTKCSWTDTFSLGKGGCKVIGFGSCVR